MFVFFFEHEVIAVSPIGLWRHWVDREEGTLSLKHFKHYVAAWACDGKGDPWGTWTSVRGLEGLGKK